MSGVASIAIIPAVLRKFETKFPRALLKLTETLFHGAEADILAGEVDFFVGPFQAESTTRSLRVETLFENRRSVIAREGHPLANATSLSDLRDARRSEEHQSELQSLMRLSYAVFCLKKKTTQLN